jgi:hypothetical protein
MDGLHRLADSSLPKQTMKNLMLMSAYEDIEED